jgi:hypothetical protein
VDCRDVSKSSAVITGACDGAGAGEGVVTEDTVEADRIGEGERERELELGTGRSSTWEPAAAEVEEGELRKDWSSFWFFIALERIPIRLDEMN